MALLLSLKVCILFLILCSSKLSESKFFEDENIEALYVFGDSLVDSGNNNHLDTFAKANFLPYGIDFEGGKPTGRFSNGKTIADYIAINYGLPLVPPYLGLSDAQRMNISTGINYASGSCGTFPETGKRQGTCLSLSNQTELFKKTLEIDLPKLFKTEDKLHRHLAESLFMIVIGVNDYNELYNATETDPNTFADKLLDAFSTQLEKLYELGARRFFINTIKPLGCYPNKIVNTNPRGSCDEQTNKAISLYNTKLKHRLNAFRHKLSGTSFVYSDYFSFMLSLRGPSRYRTNSRLLNAVSPCCPRIYNGTGFCFPGDTPCTSRDMHMFFDPFHPTQLCNFMYVIRCFRDREICERLKD